MRPTSHRNCSLCSWISSLVSSPFGKVIEGSHRPSTRGRSQRSKLSATNGELLGLQLACNMAQSKSTHAEILRIFGGEGGIRTHGTVTRTTVFETVPFDHSGTSPKASTCGNGGRERTFIVLVSWRQLEARPKQTSTLR